MLPQQPQPQRNLGGNGNGNGNATPNQNQSEQKTKKRKYNCEPGGEGPSSVKFQAIDTGIECTTAVYNWRLRNYAIFRKYDHLLEQQKFQFAITDKNEVTTTWEFSLKRVPGRDVNDTKDWISVRQKLISIQQAPPPESGSGNGSVSRTPPPPDKIWSKCTVEIKSQDGTSQLFKHCEKIAESTLGKVLVRKKFLPRDTKIDKLPLINGTLTIQVTFSVYSGITLHTLTPHENHTKLSLDAMAKDSYSKSHEFLASLENDRESADVTITSKDGEIFHCHRLILSKKSPVFEAMFRSNSGNEAWSWKEKQSGAIKLEDLSGRAVKILVHFIYTGQLSPDWADCSENLFEITYGANKYDLKDLVEFLDSNLALFCGMKDALKMLVLCNKLQMKKAQREIFNSVIKKRPGNDEEFMQALMAFHEEQ